VTDPTNIVLQFTFQRLVMLKMFLAVRCAFFDRNFHSKMPLDSIACSLEAKIRVTNGIPLGSPLPLTVTTINHVETLKAGGMSAFVFAMYRFLNSSRFVASTTDFNAW
jgi:hypothetical protein